MRGCRERKWTGWLAAGAACLCAALALPAAAQEGDAAGGAGGQEERAALTPEERQLRMLAATGGLLTRPGEGGALLVLDLTGGKAGETVGETARLVGDVLKVRVLSEKRKAVRGHPEKELRAALAPAGVAAVVAVIADKGQPSLLIAPEDRWAVVNAAPVLDAGGDARDVRLRKEIWRAVGFLMGAGTSGKPGCPFRPVFAVGDLDAFSGFPITPATMAAVTTYAKAAGLAQTRQSTYRRAVEEGWAPAPTNDFQKAIWEEVKSK
ncbi:MAG: hypothetical protein FWH21_04090 [Kiritimatiellaeota bacterium]|nr:hypothetical protein [Kiritimatiellota bacterium]